MTPEQRIERLEKVLGILISWLHKDLGEVNSIELLQLLEEGHFPAYLGCPAKTETNPTSEVTMDNDRGSK